VTASGLILACGNPSRGDDAIGPLLIERFGAIPDPTPGLDLELLTDYQLQVEHALDLQGRDIVVFVDAALDGPEPFGFGPVISHPVATITTHATTPGALLRVYGQVVGRPPPDCRLLAIRGYAFELGSGLTPGAEANLEAALAYLGQWLRNWHGGRTCRKFSADGVCDSPSSNG
jgi:hydrogenase maturation protease